jgi:predicted lysophospholipase L1 biosynthesis ABC-type transport system permease subunit
VRPQEWWLALDGAAATGGAAAVGHATGSGSGAAAGSVRGDPAEAVAAAARAAPISATDVVSRADLSRTLSGDPVALGVVGALGLGALAALGIAAIGFLASTSVSTSERIGEIALLRALGLAPGQAVRWLALESAFLLVFALIGGLALGLLLAWLILPFATVTATGAAAIPAPVVVVPVEAIVPLIALAGLLLVVTVLLVARQVTRMTVSSVLRTTEA